MRFGKTGCEIWMQMRIWIVYKVDVPLTWGKLMTSAS